MARVLVIDDEPDLVRLLIKILGGRGHLVAVARDGAKALERVTREPPELLIVDSDLPELDGAEVCRRIKANPRTSHIPVLMMTSGYVDIYDVQQQGGPDGYVIRPFARDVLANAVDRLVRPARRSSPVVGT